MKNISIITPSFNINGSDMSIRISTNNQRNIVYAGQSDNYVVLYKDGSRPDVQLATNTADNIITSGATRLAVDETIVCLLAEAKFAKFCIDCIIEYFENNEAFSNDILDDRKVISSILDYVIKQSNGYKWHEDDKHDINWHILSYTTGTLDIQRYRKQ